MSATLKPTDWIPGYTSDGTNLTIPIASLAGLTAADADAATGDIRKVILASAKQLDSVYAAASPKPAGMMVTGDGIPSNGQLAFSFKFQVVATGYQFTG